VSITIFLVDDHEIVRRGIAELLAGEPDMVVVGEASDISHARARIAATRPSIVLLDVRLPDGSGIDLCRDLLSTSSEMSCIMLTAYDDEEAMSAAVLAGASGYVLKDIRGTQLIDSVRRVSHGQSLMNPVLTKRLVARMTTEPAEDPRLGSLGLREKQILELIAAGLTNREIGERLNLAEKTIKNYVSSLLSKLGLQHRTQAAILRLSAQSEA
jgi:two-component system response regulator DevR